MGAVVSYHGRVRQCYVDLTGIGEELLGDDAHLVDCYAEHSAPGKDPEPSSHRVQSEDDLRHARNGAPFGKVADDAEVGHGGLVLKHEPPQKANCSCDDYNVMLHSPGAIFQSTSHD